MYNYLHNSDALSMYRHERELLIRLSLISGIVQRDMSECEQLQPYYGSLDYP